MEKGEKETETIEIGRDRKRQKLSVSSLVIAVWPRTVKILNHQPTSGVGTPSGISRESESPPTG